MKLTREVDNRTILTDGGITTEVRDLKLNIEDLRVFRLSSYMDDRGYVRELWKNNYFPDARVEQVYFATCTKNVIKCWHFHSEHRDRLCVITGRVKLGLVDKRPGSAYFDKQDSLVIDANINPMIVEVPTMVYHGMMGLAEESIVLNIPTHVYDPADEHKAPADSIDFPWEIKNR